VLPCGRIVRLGAVARVTGKDEESIKRYYATFKTLASLAKFDPKPSRALVDFDKAGNGEASELTRQQTKDDHEALRRRSEYHYNIQIHLPATTDVTVYNAIFKSLKEHLGV
jgi:hypothetical protein